MWEQESRSVRTTAGVSWSAEAMAEGWVEASARRSDEVSDGQGGSVGWSGLVGWGHKFAEWICVKMRVRCEV